MTTTPNASEGVPIWYVHLRTHHRLLLLLLLHESGRHLIACISHVRFWRFLGSNIVHVSVVQTRIELIEAETRQRRSLENRSDTKKGEILLRQWDKARERIYLLSLQRFMALLIKTGIANAHRVLAVISFKFREHDLVIWAIVAKNSAAPSSAHQAVRNLLSCCFLLNCFVSSSCSLPLRYEPVLLAHSVSPTLLFSFQRVNISNVFVSLSLRTSLFCSSFSLSSPFVSFSQSSSLYYISLFVLNVDFSYLQWCLRVNMPNAVLHLAQSLILLSSTHRGGFDMMEPKNVTIITIRVNDEKGSVWGNRKGRVEQS